MLSSLKLEWLAMVLVLDEFSLAFQHLFFSIAACPLGFPDVRVGVEKHHMSWRMSGIGCIARCYHGC